MAKKTIYYINPSAGSNGDGSLASPYNTIVGLPTQQNRIYLLKTGTTIREDLGPLLNGDGNEIGCYGTGALPNIDFSTLATGFTFNATYGIWQKNIAITEFGNATEDGVPLRAIQWGASNNIATIGPLMTAGSVAFDRDNTILYIKPTTGSFTDHQYRYSAGLYCIRSNNSNKNNVIQDIFVRMASRHGISLYNKKRVKIKNVHGGILGGYWESGRADYLGNGIELSAGCIGAEVIDCEMNDVWDSPFTSQLYETAASIMHGHYYYNIKANRFGLCGLEISTPSNNSNQKIRNIYCEWGEFTNGNTAQWMNKGAGVGVSAVSSLCNGSVLDKSCSISEVYFSKIRAKNVGRLWSTSNTQGTCYLLDSVGDNMQQYDLRKVVDTAKFNPQVDVLARVNVINSTGVVSELGGTFTYNDNYELLTNI